MKILIIGGTSFFGKEIVKQALNARHEVTVFSRGSNRPDFWDSIEHIPGDRNNASELAQKLANRQFDAVIDNIAFNSQHVESLVTALHGQIGRYILTSTTAVYIGAGPFQQPLRESHAVYDLPPNPQLASFPKPTGAGMINYASGKIAAEKALIGQGLPYTIIRPHIVMGPQDNSGRLQFYCQRLLDGKPIIMTNGGVQSVQFVFSRDLARSYLQALHSPNAANQVYTLAADKTCRLVDWVELLAGYLGVQPQLVAIPDDFMQRAGFSYAENWVLRGTLTFDVSKAIKDLGFQAAAIETMTQSAADWYRRAAHADDSPGYALRAEEVAFVEKYRERNK